MNVRLREQARGRSPLIHAYGIRWQIRRRQVQIHPYAWQIRAMSWPMEGKGELAVDQAVIAFIDCAVQKTTSKSVLLEMWPISSEKRDLRN